MKLKNKLTLLNSKGKKPKLLLNMPLKLPLGQSQKFLSLNNCVKNKEM